MVFSVRDRFDLFLPESAANSVSESGFSRAISVSSSRFLSERTLAKLSMDVNQTVGSPLAGR